MKKTIFTPVALAALAAAASLPVSALQVQMSSAKGVLKASDDAVFSITITNEQARPVRLLKWDIPGETDEAHFFNVTRDGQPVLYIGKHYKRAAPSKNDYLVLRPGQSITRSIELSTQFDLSVAGSYQFSYAPHAEVLGGRDSGLQKQRGELEFSTHSDARSDVNVWIEGSHQSRFEQQMKAQQSIANAISIQGVSYSSNCSSSRQSTIASAFSTSQGMASNALSYLNGSTVGARYTTWFGSYTSSRWATAKSHFANIVSAQNTQNVVFDCSCTSSAYAYVYPTQPYKVYLCNAFWNAPLSGTDSKGGTIVHELSHFNVVAATDDHAYGQTAAKKLARTKPTKALDNADNHEYFAENTPYQN